MIRLRPGMKIPNPGIGSIFLILEIILFVVQLIARHMSDDDIISEMMDNYSLSKNQAQELYRKVRK